MSARSDANTLNYSNTTLPPQYHMFPQILLCLVSGRGSAALVWGYLVGVQDLKRMDYLLTTPKTLSTS